jgi:hypothetical protein
MPKHYLRVKLTPEDDYLTHRAVLVRVEVDADIVACLIYDKRDPTTLGVFFPHIAIRYRPHDIAQTWITSRLRVVVDFAPKPPFFKDSFEGE